MRVWRHHAHKFSSLANDSSVQSWGIDMLNLHDWLRTSIMHLLWEKVKCACTSQGAQHSAESYGRWVVYCTEAFFVHVQIGRSNSCAFWCTLLLLLCAYFIVTRMSLLRPFEYIFIDPRAHSVFSWCSHDNANAMTYHKAFSVIILIYVYGLYID